MSPRRRIPAGGDVPVSLVAEFGLSLTDCEGRRPRERFPEPDSGTGLYCIEAADRWRMRRHRRLFIEFRSAPIAAHAGAVFDERLGPFDGRPIVDASRASGHAADKVSPYNTVEPSIGRDLRVNAKAKADGFSKLYSCLGRPDVQIVTANAPRVVRTSWALEIATRASG